MREQGARFLTLSELLRVAYTSVVLWGESSLAKCSTHANRRREWTPSKLMGNVPSVPGLSGTFETAWYGYYGGGATVGSASKGIAIAGYAGFAWNCPDADAYTDVADYLTVPLSALGNLVALIPGLGKGAPTDPSHTNPVTVSWSPTTPTFAVTTGVTASVTGATPATTPAGIAWASGLGAGSERYALLSGDVKFK